MPVDAIKKYSVAGELRLSVGFIQRVFEGKMNEEPIIQIMTHQDNRGKKNQDGAEIRLRIHDGAFFYSAAFLTKDALTAFDNDPWIAKNDQFEVIAVKKYRIAQDWNVKGKTPILIDSFELLHRCPLVKSIYDLVQHTGNADDDAGLKNLSNVVVCSSDGGPVKAASASAPALTRTGPPAVSTKSSSMTSGTTPISAITPYINKWRILGVCSAREEMKTIKTARGDSKVFNFELTDAEGSSIRIVAFGEQAERVFPLLNQGEYYYVERGSIRAANKRFNTTGLDYEIMIKHDSEVTLCNDSQLRFSQPALSLRRITLDHVPQHTQENVDVLAVIDRIDPVDEFTSKAGNALTKRNIGLVDESGTTVDLVVWGESARAWEDSSVGTAIALKGAQVKEFNGGFTLACNTNRIHMNPTIDAVSHLYSWWEQNQDGQRVTISAPTIMGGGEASFARDLRLLGTAVEMQLGAGNVPVYMNVKAMVVSVRGENAVYKACAQKDCKKKVVELSGEYRCEKCNVTSSDYKYQYMLSLEIADNTNMVWVSMFGDQATKMIGKDADEVGRIKEQSEDEAKKIFDDLRFKNYVFRIRAKGETYNDEEKIRYNVMSADAVKWDKYSAQLDVCIDKLSQLK